MRTSLLVAAAGVLIAPAFANGIHARHAELHRRNDYPLQPKASETCSCTTYTTTYYGEPTLVHRTTVYTTVEVSPTPVSSKDKYCSTHVTPAPSPIHVATYPSQAPAPVPAPAPAPAPVHPKPESQPTPQKPNKGPATIHANGQLWAITYTPYTPAGQCKSASEVDEDIADISSKGYAAVRTYGTDCNGLQNIGSACKAHGLQIIIGVFIDATGIEGAKGQVDQIVAWGQFNIVQLVVVGNEAVFQGRCSGPQLAAFIVEVRTRLVGAGYNGPLTTTEPLNILQENAVHFCSVIDVTGANIQPFFNAGTSPEQAGSFVASQLEIVASLCPGKPAYNLECGWPKAGSTNGLAVPGVAEQRTAIAGIIRLTGDRSVMFSYHDDEWKGNGVHNVESSWGVRTCLKDVLGSL